MEDQLAVPGDGRRSPTETHTRMFQPEDSRNAQLLTKVGRRGHFPPSARIDLGTHYDLIDHLWQTCNSYVQDDCRWIVGFRPALVNPQTGVAFAIAIGTNYYLRITEAARTRYVADLKAKARSDGERIGIGQGDLDRYVSSRTGHSDIGEAWMTGCFLSDEDQFILQAYADSGEPSDRHGAAEYPF